jgi:hypothetical protein
MPNTVSGSVIHILPEQTGAGKNGTWRKRDFVIETKDQYPKKICMTQWGDEITAHIDIASREYNGRWYTDVKAWKIELGDSDGFIEEGNAAPVSKKTPPPLVDVDDDLPF